jgi:hypothetical protein
MAEEALALVQAQLQDRPLYDLDASRKASHGPALAACLFQINVHSNIHNATNTPPPLSSRPHTAPLPSVSAPSPHTVRVYGWVCRARAHAARTPADAGCGARRMHFTRI